MSKDMEDELRELRRECGYDGYDEFQDDPEFVAEHGDGSSVDALIGYKDALEDLAYRLSKLYQLSRKGESMSDTDRVVNQLVIRDPDHENDYVTDGSINVVEIDIGGQWEAFKYFASDLSDGEHAALYYEQSIMDEVKDLAEDNPVRMAAEQFFQDARDYRK